jgi:hypothetical protein
MNRWKFDEVMELNGQKLTKKYIASLNKEDREALVEPIFQMIRRDLPEFPYPDDLSKVDKEWKRIVEYVPDLSTDIVYNNDSRATYIGKFFCKDFYNTKGPKDKMTMPELFQDDTIMRKLIWNRLGLGWIDDEGQAGEVFNLSGRMFLQGMRSTRMILMASFFKPSVAKYITMKYSNPGDIIYDYSAGWGARMLGAACCDRGYIGVDPLTTPSLEEMARHLNLKNVTLINSGSEDYIGEENSAGLAYSSPPYYDTEVYSNDLSQAYAKGPDYFFQTYWQNTLINTKRILKPDGYFGLVLTNQDQMLAMAKEQFGEIVEIVKLKTVRSHLNKSKLEDIIKKDPVKYENAYIFRNVK